MMKNCSVVHIEQKMEFVKFNRFFVDFLRYSFERMKVISTMVEGEYTPEIAWQICFVYQLTGFYMIIGFTERYFLTDYSYILENHFYLVNAPDYCFKLSLYWILCVNSSVKVLSSQYEGSSTHIFHTSPLCTFIIYKKKEIGFVVKIFSKYYFGPKVIRIICLHKYPDSKNQVKLCS